MGPRPLVLMVLMVGYREIKKPSNMAKERTTKTTKGDR
jgi:hypothetical protein